MSESESSKDNLTIHVGTVVNIPANTTIVGDVRISEKHEIHIKCNPIIAALSFSVGALFAYFIYLIKKTTCTNTNTNHAGGHSSSTQCGWIIPSEMKRTLFSLILCAVLVSTVAVSVYEKKESSEPTVVIIGATGVGKSSLANALLGCDPLNDTCLFPVCDSMNSCTKHGKFATGKWLGVGPNFKVVDTPGTGASEEEDDLLIQAMTDVLKNGAVGQTNSILLLLDGRETRFNRSLQSMLRQMSYLFGKEWWELMTIGVSFWNYDQCSIHNRNELCSTYPSKCKNETWFEHEINEQLQKKFHLTKNFTFVFTHSWSQTMSNYVDLVQQDHWRKETQKLWDAMSSSETPFEFRTRDDLSKENKWLKEHCSRNDIQSKNNIQEDIDLSAKYIV